MLERLKNVISGGAQSRTVKQSSDDTPEVPLVDEYMSAIIGAISTNEDVPISIRSLSELTGITPSKVRGNINKLVEAGIIVKSKSRQGQSARYWINRGPISDKITETRSVVIENSQELGDIVESLIWEFVRETRATDVLLFLTWLERRLGGDEGI